MDVNFAKIDWDRLNWTQCVPGQRQGHYESFYQRANHPTRPLAFWIRYTTFSPNDRPEAAIGELWAIFFDGETGEHVVAKEEHPIAECDFATRAFSARVKDSVLGPGSLKGQASSFGNTIGWNLTYSGDQQPLFLLPHKLYSGNFPKAKSLVRLPLANYDGSLTVKGRDIDVTNWLGSQNHNWGIRHTDYYAFGQVAGFDDDPDSFLEIITAKIKVAGPVKTPFLTMLVLRHGGREYALTSILDAVAKTQGRFHYFHWEFSADADEVKLDGQINATPDAFVGLNYYNPPGGIKHCLNTKIGSCELTFLDKETGQRHVLRTKHRALFEILTDDRTHGISIRA
ncbi:MAG: hypothetical protein JO272_06355 [Pseudonocardiales bacterium]|nr:hypothetical protein [Pseudonocardiales bacterium]